MVKVWDINSQEYKDEVARIEKDALDNKYATDRKDNYLPLGDLAGALYDYFLQKRLNGEELPEELNNWVSDCTKVKIDYPKPETEE